MYGRVNNSICHYRYLVRVYTPPPLFSTCLHATTVIWYVFTRHYRYSVRVYTPPPLFGTCLHATSVIWYVFTRHYRY